MLYSRNKLQGVAGPLMIASAYAGASTTGSYTGGLHLIVTADLLRGRLSRSAGDALCKPAKKFWGLEPDPERDLSDVTCKRCSEISARLQLTEAQ